MSIDLATLLYFRMRKAPRDGNGAAGLEKKTIEASVLVPAFNEGKRLRETVEGILRQTYPVKKVYILDDMSTDETPEVSQRLCREHANVAHVRETKRGKAGNINAILKERNTELGDYVLVVDGDIVLKEDCLEQLASMADGAAVVTGFGDVRNPPSFPASAIYAGETWTNGVFSFRKRAQSKRNAIAVICGALSLYRRDVLEAIPIPERTKTEDTDYTWLLLERGHKVVYNPQAKARGGSPDSLAGYWRRYTRWFCGTYQALFVHGRDLHKSKPLLYTTLLPGVVEATAYSATFASLPALYYFAPDVANGIVLADLLLTAPFLGLHPKGFWHGVMDLPKIYAYKYFGSLVGVYSAVKTAAEKVGGRTQSWVNNWESSSRV